MDSANNLPPRPGATQASIEWKGLALAGLLLLAAWSVYWGCSLYQGHALGTRWTWQPGWPFVGLDFLNNYHATRHWQNGGNPYSNEDFGDPLQRKFAYPPIVLGLFAWCRFLPQQTAVLLWIGSLAAIAALAAWNAGRTRCALQLWSLPLPFTVAALLTSTPIFYALERGNCDLLALLCILPGVWALRGRSLGHDCLAGSCLALAAWIKIYPGILLLGLLPLRRQRAFCCGGLAALGLGIPQWSHLAEFLHNARELSAQHAPFVGGQIGATTHTLSGCWKLLWTAKGWTWLGQIPPTLAATALVAPILLWVSWRIFRCPPAVSLHYPYLVWLVGAATYLPLVSNDYNLFFLPLAALAVWDRRDPVWVHLLMGYMMLWWQPFWLPIGPKLLLLSKLLALLAVGGSLVTRAAEQTQGLASPKTAASGAQPPLPVAA